MTGHEDVRAAVAALAPAAPLAVLDRFAADLRGYAELIVGPGAGSVGFMTRGEGPAFTRKGAATLEELGMPGEALAHHLFLAAWFEHRRAFFKVEWSGGSPLAACYFRRRPEIGLVLRQLHRLGVAAAALDEVVRLAAVLGKRTAHFVSAAFRPGEPVHHKLYFSQIVDEGLPKRLEAVFGRCGGGEPMAATWRRAHARWAAGHSGATLFVSFHVTADRLVPSFKIDYPDVSPGGAAEWLDGEPAVAAEAAATCRAMGRETLSYLGVRFDAPGSRPRLKYYVDPPRDSSESISK